jgi:uncharacterized membrane protein YfcA
VLGADGVITSWPQLLAAALVLGGAAFVYVLLGFGAGLVAVGALALILPDLRDVVVLLLLLGLPAEAWVVFTQRRWIRWRGVLLIATGVVVGVPLGTWALGACDPTLLVVTLGAFLVVAGSAFLLVPEHRRVDWPPWSAPLVGLSSGLLSGTLGTGGPPLVLYFKLGGADKGSFRGNLMAVFLLLTLVRWPSYAVAGFITPARLFAALLLLPAVLVGAFIGHRLQLDLPEARFRRLISVALVALGVVLLVREV